MDHFEVKHGELWCEDVPLTAIAERSARRSMSIRARRSSGTRRCFRAALSELPRSVDRLRAEVEPQPGGAQACCSGRASAPTSFPAARWRARLPPAWRRATSSFRASARHVREMAAALDAGIGQFNLESEEEGSELSRIAAARGLRAACALRVNPDVDAGTHEKISTGKADNKFGVPISRAEQIYARLAGLPGLEYARPGSPHRQPAHRPRAARARVREARRADRRVARRKVTGSPTPTSAAGSACPTRPAKSCRARPTMARWSRA